MPGLVLAMLLGLTTWWRARKNDYPRQPKASWGERWRAFRESIWGLLLIIVVIGGIYTGIFTPTEAAAMSAVYAFIVAVFVYKDMPLSKVPKVLLDSANMSAMLLYIITNAVMFSYLMTSEQIPQALAAWMIEKGLGVITFLLVVNILLLLAGNVMEPSSIVLIMAPILFPVAMKLGIDPIHFGIMMVVNMEVGMCHPPVGLNLYVASGITKMGITELTIAVWPWLLTMLGFLVLVTYWPGLSLWLPRALGMMAEAFPGFARRGRLARLGSRSPQARQATTAGAEHRAGAATRSARSQRAPDVVIIIGLPRFATPEPKNGRRTHAFHHQARCRGQERHRRNLCPLRESGAPDCRCADDASVPRRRRGFLRRPSRAAVFQGSGRFHDDGTGDGAGSGG